MDKLTVLPHEFLYILANSYDRQKIIKENHVVDLKGTKEEITHWEI